jgi:diaminohydroxyphosphoribosylaminopyrimidine deaminase / 5-amino-6-(5-phosphoribosylamino)uracil reductase
MTVEDDIPFLRRALRLAMNGRGAVEPNPMVGCVIVRDGRIIGEGFHAKFGSVHAEPAALSACTESPAGATVYVTMEPCCHTNKKTPPCAPRLVEAKVRRVVFGCLDPNPDVNGRGITMLREAGVDVDGPLLEPEARQLNAAFFKGTIHQRPYVTLKWAQSADGKVAGPGGKKMWISGSLSTRAIHELRARCDSILIGIGTALNDDPLLTSRGVVGARPLRRAVLDTSLRISLDSQLVHTGAGEVVIFCSREVYRRSPRVAELQRLGVDVHPVKPDPRGGVSLDDVLFDLDNWGEHVLVEAGPTLAARFLEQNLADRVWVLQSPTQINDETAPSAVLVPYPIVAEADLEGDHLTEYLNPTSPVYFSPVASADFIRVTEDPTTSREVRGVFSPSPLEGRIQS